jgi:hypothetical protein
MSEVGISIGPILVDFVKHDPIFCPRWSHFGQLSQTQFQFCPPCLAPADPIWVYFVNLL